MSMNRVLLIYEDDSFKVMSMEEYNDYLDQDVPHAEMEIYRSSQFTDPRQYKCLTRDFKTYWRKLSEFPDEIKALIVLYEI